jgi:ubiquinone/menaquinone biosynthesis C-methylase UbiE
MEQSMCSVENFWDENICGAHFVNADYLSSEFFESYRKFRYKKEHHLNSVVDWEASSGKSVLEIGLGLGADATRWSRHAKHFTGVDLTGEAVMATKRHFEILGLEGDIRQANAESLPFKNESFDLISSHGVLHHTNDINLAMREIFRVLKPGGTFVVMLYAKHSFNYWVRIQCGFRAAFLTQLVRSKLGYSTKEPWTSHLKNYRGSTNYFSWSEWPHHCTDGPDCKVANIYSWRQVKAILSNAGFHIRRRQKTHFPVGLSPKFEQAIAKAIGFYQFAECNKPCE